MMCLDWQQLWCVAQTASSCPMWSEGVFEWIFFRKFTASCKCLDILIWTIFILCVVLFIGVKKLFLHCFGKKHKHIQIWGQRDYETRAAFLTFLYKGAEWYQLTAEEMLQQSNIRSFLHPSFGLCNTKSELSLPAVALLYDSSLFIDSCVTVLIWNTKHWIYAPPWQFPSRLHHIHTSPVHELINKLIGGFHQYHIYRPFITNQKKQCFIHSAIKCHDAIEKTVTKSRSQLSVVILYISIATL